ncbi:MAG: TonB-dependent receptor [Myxococcaceae bacterium]
MGHTANFRFVPGARALVLLASLAAGAAFAQGSSVLTGTVSDASTKKPVADVVVTATSPALQGEQLAVTDPTGQYRIAQLPPGVYTLRLEKESFRPFSRGDIQVRVDRTIRVNVELLPEALKAEEIVVVGRTPTVDTASTTTGVNLSPEFLKNIALVQPGGKNSASRSFESLAAVAPGAQSDQFGVSVNGTTSPENQFIIDGLSVNDPAVGILGMPLTMDFIQEVNVITGGYMPEFGRSTGGVLNVVTKSGSNEFHGSVFGNWTPGSLEGQRTRVVRDGTTINTERNLWNLGDFGAELGGPIMKDKLWFYAGFAPAFTRYQLSRSLNRRILDANGEPVVDDATGFTQVEQIDGTTRDYFADQRTFQYIGKLTYMVNSDHHVSLSVLGTPTQSGGNGSFDVDPRDGSMIANILGPYQAQAVAATSNANAVVLKTNSSFLEKNLLVDATLGWHHQDVSSLPVDGSGLSTLGDGAAGTPGVVWKRSIDAANQRADGSYPPGFHSILDFESGQYLDENGNDLLVKACAEDSAGMAAAKACPVDYYRTGGPGYIDSASLDRYQGKAVATYLVNSRLGHHVAKAGVDLESMVYSHEKAYSGTVYYSESRSGGTITDGREYGYMTGPDQVTVVPSVVTSTQSLTAGAFLQDSWNVLDLVTMNAGLRYDTQQLIGSDGKLALNFPSQISPRLGVVYDFTQQGRSKIFANFARYYESVPLNIADRGFPPERSVNVVRYTGANASRPGCNPLVPGQAKGDCRDPSNLYDVGGVYTDPEDPNRHWLITGGDPSPIDPNLQPQSSDELVFGGEYEILPDARAGASYVYRRMNMVIEDMSNDEATTYFIGNPGYGIAKDFPKATRDYDAITLYFSKNFSDLWLAQASYTYARLYGNYSGLFRPETGQLDPNANSTYDLKSLLENGTGPLPGDVTHSIKVFAAKEFVLSGTQSFALGMSYRGNSGTPLNYYGAHEIYLADETLVLPRGSAGRLPWTHAFDTKVGYGFKLSRESTLSASVEVFNLFNFQGITGRDERYTADDVRPIKDAAGLDTYTNIEGNPVAVNPNFKNPSAYQAPREVRFGAKLTF